MKKTNPAITRRGIEKMEYEYNPDFFYKKVQVLDKDGAYHLWYLINRKQRQGVHFHGRLYKEPSDYVKQDNRYGFMAHGIESHNRQPVYDEQTPVEGCEVTGGKCYCDGSSLQASERLGYINPNRELDDSYIWAVLHEYYESWITEIPEPVETQEQNNDTE